MSEALEVGAVFLGDDTGVGSLLIVLLLLLAGLVRVVLEASCRGDAATALLTPLLLGDERGLAIFGMGGPSKEAFEERGTVGCVIGRLDRTWDLSSAFGEADGARG